jgi:uncharacterized membrane protein YesL
MKNWANRNYRTLIIFAFIVPIIIVAFVSISHVTVWYDISNPSSWAMYLSVGIEIAALSALAAISANMGRKVYFPFAIVTLIQFIGNIFFAHQYIDINGKLFKDWVDLVSPILSLMGVDENNLIGHKRFLALFSGGLLPLISLSFLHMIVKFTEEDRLKDQKIEEEEKKYLINDEILEEEKKKWEQEFLTKHNIEQPINDEISEITRLKLSDEQIKKLEEILLNPSEPSENLKSASVEYRQKLEETENIININEYDKSYDFENEEGNNIESQTDEYSDINIENVEVNNIIDENEEPQINDVEETNNDTQMDNEEEKKK